MYYTVVLIILIGNLLKADSENMRNLFVLFSPKLVSNNAILLLQKIFNHKDLFNKTVCLYFYREANRRIQVLHLQKGVFRFIIQIISQSVRFKLFFGKEN